MRRRTFVACLAAGLTRASNLLPGGPNLKWSLSAGLWSHYPPGLFTDILDVMKDTGFVGIRLTGYPGILKTYNLTQAQLQKEVSKRKLFVVTCSFGGPVDDPNQHAPVVQRARESMTFLKDCGAKHLVVFPPAKLKAGANVDAAFNAMCKGFNLIGEAANEMGFQAGVHNHLDTLVEGPAEVDRCMASTDPKLFNFAPDTGHLHLGGSNVVEKFDRYRDRLVFMDYKDARWTTPEADLTLPNGKVELKNSPEAKFFESIYDLGDGDIDFPACHRILKQIAYKGWICVDLDTTRDGPRRSYSRCGNYIISRLQPIYA